MVSASSPPPPLGKALRAPRSCRPAGGAWVASATVRQVSDPPPPFFVQWVSKFNAMAPRGTFLDHQHRARWVRPGSPDCVFGSLSLKASVLGLQPGHPETRAGPWLHPPNGAGGSPSFRAPLKSCGHGPWRNWSEGRGDGGVRGSGGGGGWPSPFSS